MTTKFDYDVPGQYFVDGVIHQMPVELPDVLQKVKTFPLTPEDVVIATYRKAGELKKVLTYKREALTQCVDLIFDQRRRRWSNIK